VGEGRWEPSNAPVVKIADSELSWDFTAEKSDYEKVRADKLAATDGEGWLIESARSYDPSAIKDPLENFVQSDPTASGYGGDGKTPEDALAEDLDALMGGLAGGAWVTRLTADLSRKAFAQDLTLGASADQTQVDGAYQITNGINKPACPPDPCGGGGGTGGTGNPTGGSADGESSSCNLRAGGGGEGGAHIALIGLGALLALARRRRR
jgi:MYXO-CTERM domain-containing protein